ncbi:ArgK/MeaB family GTPase [Rhodovulum sp. DZ06]|uniref:ArgK/MeaB family GTPase n=1 Tax=Rhodovulum sp. DZ06 TaxID=3425126 RepID=UPI003D346E74
MTDLAHAAPAADAGAPDGASLLSALRAGGKAALARFLARCESHPEADDVVATLDAAQLGGKGHAVGLTGPPGVGKSTLTDALIRDWRRRGLTVGVIAVDPSSRASRGALLGDRTRLTTDPTDQGVFVRSMAARDRLGGLAELTWPAVVAMRAVYDRVLIETVGVGQSETEIADMADTVVLCIQPGSGDALQFMKSGIMEIPHFVVVTKADMGGPARRALSDLKGALSLAPPRPDGWTAEALSCSAADGAGVAETVDAVERRIAGLSAEPGAESARRSAQARAWAALAFRDQFGRKGLARAEKSPAWQGLAAAPFRESRDLARSLSAALDLAEG